MIKKVVSRARIKHSLTPEQRLHGYVEALRMIRHDSANGEDRDDEYSPYVCDCLDYVLDEMFGQGIIHDIEYAFPEFYKYQPKKHDFMDSLGLGWWPLNEEGKKKRIEVLEEIIKSFEDDFIFNE